MKIRSVQATWLEVPIPEDKQHTSDFGRMRSFNTVLVRIETEDGLVGHGEAKAEEHGRNRVECFHGSKWLLLY